MKYKHVLILLLILSLLFVVGCNTQSRYSGAVPYQQQGSPPPAAGGCGLAPFTYVENGYSQGNVMPYF